MVGMVMTYFTALFWHLPGGAAKYQRELDRLVSSLPRFKLCSFQICHTNHCISGSKLLKRICWVLTSIMANTCIQIVWMWCPMLQKSWRCHT